MDRLPPRRRIYDQFTDNDEPYAANYPLSKQILDYYYKFGQERNLERYLKLNRSLGSKSSSEGSLDRHSGRTQRVHFAPPPTRERAKSLEHMDRRRAEEKLLPTESTSYQSCVDQLGGSGDEVEESSSSELIVGTTAQTEAMKDQRRVTVRRENGGRKSYQINVESKVEIAFPSQFYQAMTAGMGFPVQQEVAREQPKVVCIPVAAVIPPKEEVEEEEPPIEVSLNQTAKNASTITEFQPVSPASSIASNKQRLEWDSLGDVGYQRSQSVDCVSRPKKSSVAIQSKSASEPPTLTSSKSTGAIPKRKIEQLPETEKPSLTAEPLKPEKWKQLLKRVKEKSSIIMESSSSHLETPSSKILFNANSSKFAQSTPVASPEVVESACQTNDIGQVSKSIQAIYEHSDKTTSMSVSSSGHESTAGSFEFMKGSQVDCKSTSSSVSSSVTGTVAENSKRMNTLKVRKEIEQFLGNVTGKDLSVEGDLAKAVDYIAMLFESKSIDRKFKRKLVEKIISKLLRSKDGRGDGSKEATEGKTIDCCSSGGDSASSRDSTKLSDIKHSDLLKDWLKPMTNSEIEYERKRESRNQSVEEEKVPTPIVVGDHVDQPISRQKSSSNSVSINNEDKEKNLQLKCIEREIEYLERIKKLIQVGRMNLMDDTNQNVMALQGNHRLRPSESRTTAEESISLTSTRPSVSASSTSRRSNVSDWDSHKNLQIVIKDRRKLNTPPDNQPPAARHDQATGGFAELKEFVDRRTKEFAERYEKRTSLYTDPSKHYSEPRSNSEVGNHHQHHHRLNMVNASTSVNSCEFSCTGPEFVKTASTIESSASQLAAARKKTNAGKHSKSGNSETIQTASSMSFSAPIMASSRTQSKRGSKRPTQTAVKSCPESIAYTIVLNPKAMVPAAAATSSARTESTTTSTGNGSATDLLYEKVSGPGTDTARVKICETGRFRLEDFLKLNRPDFIEQAGERMEEVETARRRRAQKNQEKENLLMSPHLPRGKISQLLEQSLRDNKTSGMSSNASVIYKQQTRRKFKRLPEVVKKVEEEKKNAYKRNTKIMADVFNRNLQRIVLQGETNIPHSRRVLTTL